MAVATEHHHTKTPALCKRPEPRKERQNERRDLGRSSSTTFHLAAGILHLHPRHRTAGHAHQIGQQNCMDPPPHDDEQAELDPSARR